MIRSRKQGWEAVVVGAQQKNGYWDLDRNSNPVNGMVAVRLYFNGKPRMTFTTIRIADEDFEDKVATARAEAMEKAAALNAVGAS